MVEEKSSNEAKPPEVSVSRNFSPEEYEAVSVKLAETEKELAALKDRYLRVLADSENARKRIRQQNEEANKLQKAELLRDFLPIVDNLERAVDAARGSGDGTSIIQGIEMVLASIHEFLRGHDVGLMSTVGERFDPKFHEAVDHVESVDQEPNTVISEFNRGYKIGDRVLRPARVIVAKASEEKPLSDEQDDNCADGVEKR